MVGKKDDRGTRETPKNADGRRDRLAVALRANLLKRKAQARGRKGPETPPKEGRQRQR